MGNGRLPIYSGDSDFKHAEIILCHWCRITVPAVEVANEVCSEGVWGPFAVDNIAVGLDDEAKLFVALNSLV